MIPRLGDIVKINRSFLEEPEGVLGYIYEEYQLGADHHGVAVITENGVDLGGFSTEEYKYLEVQRESGYQYQFINVMKLDSDFETKIKPLFSYQDIL